MCLENCVNKSYSVNSTVSSNNQLSPQPTFKTCDFEEVLQRHNNVANYDRLKNTPIGEYHRIMAKYHSDRLKRKIK